MKMLLKFLFILPFLIATGLASVTVGAQEVADGMQVIESFTQQEKAESELVSVSDQTKFRVMFYMGVPLIVLLLITMALGVAMGVFGKPLFVAHMIFAGLSVTLALAHAVVGVVWFYPF